MDRISRRHRVRCVVRERRARIPATSVSKGKPAAPTKKKSRAFALLQKLCRPYFPENLDLILIGGTALLVGARGPPETWTTSLEPLGPSDPPFLYQLFLFSTLLRHDFSKFAQFFN